MCKLTINFGTEQIINRRKLDIFPVIEHGKVFGMGITIPGKNVEYDSA